MPESESDVDVKALEESLKETEKENLKKMEESGAKSGENRYAGGPIPRPPKK